MTLATWPPAPPRQFGAAELARQVRSGERSPVEVVQETLDAIAGRDPALNAFVTVDAEGALAQAAAVAARVARGEDPGPLAGVPVGVKDLEDAAGLPTRCGDPALAQAAPAARDALQVARLRAAGAVVVGKTATPQYGWKSTTDSPLSGVTRNPYAPGRTPGGSSGGSAAAVAAGMVPLATGSDGGGSLRIPAACCNLAGLKPTPGVVPASGAASWGALVGRGLLARGFRDLALALDAVAGPSHLDPSSLPRLGSFTAAAAAPAAAGLRVAWSPTLGYARPSPAVEKVCDTAVARLEQLGAVVEPVEQVFAEDPLPAWLTLAAAGLRREVRRARGGQDPPDLTGLDPGLAGLVERAGETTAAGYLAAEAARDQAAAALAAVWDRHDLLACPVTAEVAPLLATDDRGVNEWVQLTHPFNLAGCPAASVPAGFADAGGDLVPVGLQLVAPRLHDLRLLGAAAVLEDALR